MEDQVKWSIFDLLVVMAAVYFLGTVLGVVLFLVGVLGWSGLLLSGACMVGYALCLLLASR